MTDREVPHEVIPCDKLPAGRYRDLPEPPSSWTKLMGPSILLRVVYWQRRAVIGPISQIWLCRFLGLYVGANPYFINMEIERWTLATGETAVTLLPALVWLARFSCCNIPWIWPGWAGRSDDSQLGIGWGEDMRVSTHCYNRHWAGPEFGP